LSRSMLAARRAAFSVCRTFAPAVTRTFSQKHETDYLKEKESALESKYFNDNDKYLLQKLIKKMEHHESENKKDAVTRADRLEKILKAHDANISKECFHDLLRFKAGEI